ncbi:phosphoribosylamine--glycine ligase [Deferrisoma camini]|uniref:phosphoribosylamine--glycine ligase n=1 Tax=Deferrisoma camini TaxID=1035120 RepID=UPI00046D116D|nr:phosphoribosylamine--glycine ligase [Deferrisoma camini]
MKVLVVGGGGREHALVWKIAQSPRVTAVFAAPGNAGTAGLARNVPIAADDVDSLLAFAETEGVDLTVVGPEAPLVLGIVDRFRERGLRIFGPTAAAARLEGSKAFAKAAMDRFGVPTAAYREFTDPDEARAYIREQGAPIVVKADGLAAGKGVTVARTVEEALAAVDAMMVDRAFGEAGGRIVVEECLEGEEASFLAFCDGRTVLPMASSQDHKPVFDGDQGPNTGGMGAYSPAPVVSPELFDRIVDTVIRPVVDGLGREGTPYVGVLYAGLMIRGDEVKVLEFNCRFGDPECQPIVMRMKGDLVPVLEACVDGTLDRVDLEWDPRPAVCVVMASGGYPGAYEKGLEIRGLEDAAALDDVVVFHAGTRQEAGKVVTAGGRVLGVTALGSDIPSAIERAYRAVDRISWPGVHFRRDIGRKALRHLSS